MQSSGIQQTPRGNWAQLFAIAWLHSDPVLTDMRTDPKTTILELANGASGKYKELLDTLDSKTAKRTVDAALEISRLTDETPSATYSGYLPIPRSPVKDPSKLTEEDLKTLLELGLDGVLKFNLQAELWSKVLLEAWRDNEKLKAIRQDPLKELTAILGEDQVKELQESEYGILPLPNRANGLDKLEMEDLVSFLGDEYNAEHLGGIFLVAT